MAAFVNGTRLQDSAIDHSLSSDIVIVAVGLKGDRKIFNVHKDKLKKTSFFDKNGPIPTLEQKRARHEAEGQSEQAQSTSSGIKRERTVSPGTEDGIENGDSLPKTTFSVANAPDYVIESRDHDPAAFNIMVQRLYNDPPKRIRFKQDKSMLLRTYRLALRYNAYNLQNLIVQRFREYHQDYAVEFDDLKYLAHSEEIGLQCPMIAYLLEQVTYQITTDGIEAFIEKNHLFEETFKENSLPDIQFAIVRELARHAKASHGALGDPAKGFSKWEVLETGEFAGTRRDGAVDIDGEDVEQSRKRRRR